jgi:hypothetical protein
LLGTLLFDQLLPRQFLSSALLGQLLHRHLLARKLFSALLLGQALRFHVRTLLREYAFGFLLFSLPGELRRGIGLFFSHLRYCRQGGRFRLGQHEAGILTELARDHLGVQRLSWRLGTWTWTPPQDTARRRCRPGRRRRRQGRNRIAQAEATARGRCRRHCSWPRCGLGRERRHRHSRHGWRHGNARQR